MTTRAVPLLFLFLFAGLANSEEKETVNLNFIVVDIYVKMIDFTKSIPTDGSIFTFTDLIGTKNDKDVNTVISGFCKKENDIYKIVAHRITVKNNKVVRNDWFNQLLDPKTDKDRFTAMAASMGSLTLFDVRLK